MSTQPQHPNSDSYCLSSPNKNFSKIDTDLWVLCFDISIQYICSVHYILWYM